MSDFKPKDMLKGNLAETLVEELLEKLGYNVYRFGYQNNFKAIIEKKRDIKSSKSHKLISFMPDFIIIAPKEKDGHERELSFIEVKFKKDIKDVNYQEFIDKIDLIKEFYKDAFIVILTNKKEAPFQYCKVSDFKDDSSLKDFKEFLKNSINNKNERDVKEIENLGYWFITQIREYETSTTKK